MSVNKTQFDESGIVIEDSEQTEARLPGAAEESTDKTLEDRRIGRPTKLSSELRNKFCRLLRAGNYLENSAYVCGVTPQTIYNWLNRGHEQISGPERNFFDAVKKAAAFAEIEALAIAKKGKNNWQSAAWFLERRYPTRYARRKYIADTRDVREMTEEELDALVVEALEVKNPSIDICRDN